MYPLLTQTAANSLANHIHGASRVDPTRELDYFLGEVETLFPELKHTPPPAPNVAPQVGKRKDSPPFARPYGDLPPKGHIPTSRAGGSGGHNAVDTGAKPAGDGKLIDLPSASQPTSPGPRAKNTKGGGRDGGHGVSWAERALAFGRRSGRRLSASPEEDEIEAIDFRRVRGCRLGGRSRN